MKRSHAIWIFTALLVLAFGAQLTTPAEANAQALDPRAYLKPGVMILLDTSGSMSWVSNQENVYPYIPVGPPDTGNYNADNTYTYSYDSSTRSYTYEVVNDTTTTTNRPDRTTVEKKTVYTYDPNTNSYIISIVTTTISYRYNRRRRRYNETGRSTVVNSVDPTVYTFPPNSYRFDSRNNRYIYDPGTTSAVSCGRMSTDRTKDRSRLMIVQEVLTGRFFEGEVSTKCDSAFFSGSTIYGVKRGTDPDRNVQIGQHDDGMLDLYREHVKFGLMTFDNSKSTDTGKGGRYSWGPNYTAASGDFSSSEHRDNTIDLRAVNLGGRTPDALIGRTVSTGYSDNFDIVSEYNAEAQRNILNATSEGGTPLAGLMSDARYYFNNHCDERSLDEDCLYKSKTLNGRPTFAWSTSATKGIDPYGECRPRAVILIADGGDSYERCYSDSSRRYSTCYNDAYPYKDYRTADLQAEDMLAENDIKTYVIGFGPNSSMSERLRSIAFKGGTCDDMDAPDCFFKAENFDEMYRAMTRIMSDMLSVSTSRTRTATTSRVASRDSNVGMYEVAAGFDVDPNSPFWVGRLERVTYACNSSGQLEPTGEAKDFAETLRDRTTPRRIFTSTPQTRPNPANQPPAVMPLLETATDSNDEELFPNCTETNNSVSLVTAKTGDLEYYSIPSAAQYTVAPAGCTSDSDCSTGSGFTYQCAHGNCEEVASECSTGADCCDYTSGLCPFVCYSGACRKAGNDCTEHTDVTCGADDVCHLGYCRLGWRSTCAGSDTQKQQLGDISHSNPTIVGGPELDLPLPSYQAFRALHGQRDTMLYIGANDGMLHAFLLGDIGNDSNLEEGTELWSYIPQSVQGRIERLQYGREVFVDGTPVIKDLRVLHHANADVWRSVMIGGLRGGGRSYFALDVTDPHEPRFLWEHSNETPGFEALGFSYAEAEMGTVALEENGEIVERGVAFLSGGIPSDPTDPSEARVLYAVDVETGELLKAFDSLKGGEPLEPITSTPAAFNDFAGSIVSRVFVSDHRGRLLRADTSSPNPDEWTLSVFFDPHETFANERGLGIQDSAALNLSPAFSAPVFALNRTGELVIVYGNGDVDDLTNYGDDRHFVASLTEKLTVTPQGIEINNEINWFSAFEVPGEKMTGPPVIFDSVAYFATFVPSDVPCDFGFARAYGVKFEGDVTSTDTKMLASVNLDGDPNSTPDLHADFKLGTVIMGVEVASRPSCVPSQDPNNPQNVNAEGIGASASNAPQLILQTGAPASDNTGGSAPTSGTNAPIQKAQKVYIDLPIPDQSLEVLSWSAIYD